MLLSGYIHACSGLNRFLTNLSAALALFFKLQSPVEYKHSAAYLLTFMLNHHDVAPPVSLLHFYSYECTNFSSR